MNRGERLAVLACTVISWMALTVAVLTMVPLAFRIAAQAAGRSPSGSLAIAVIVPVMWAIIGVGLRRIAVGMRTRRDDG